MAGVRKFQRNDIILAVQYIPGDIQAEQAIRGWTGLPLIDNIGLLDGIWVVKQNNQVFLVENENFKADFIEVFDGA